MIYLDDKLYYTSFIAHNPLPVFWGYICVRYLCPTALAGFRIRPEAPMWETPLGIISEKVEHGIRQNRSSPELNSNLY